MLPIRSNIYKRTMRFMSDPYVRMKKRAVFGAIIGLIVLYLLMTRLFNYEPLEDHDDDDKDGGFSSKALRKQQHTSLAPKRITEDDDKKLIGKFPHIPPYEEGRDKKYKDINDGGGDAGAAGDKDDKNHHVDSHKKKPHSTHEPQKYRPPFLLRLILPLIAGFCFGFMGSVPIAGPTSAMVLRVGIQGEYETALTIAVGGAISEATYAGIAFWGFGSFLAGAKFLLPVSKVLGAITFTIVGTIFLRSEVRPPPLEIGSSGNSGLNSPSKKRRQHKSDEFYKNVLMGLTMSGINPALLATYTGAIASVYGTGVLEFNLFLAFVFAIGVCSGVSTWFYILLSLLKKYNQRLKGKTIGLIMKCLGGFLLTLGLLCAKSSIEYFFFDTNPSTVPATIASVSPPLSALPSIQD